MSTTITHRPTLVTFLSKLQGAPSYSLPDPTRRGYWIVYRLVRDEDVRHLLSEMGIAHPTAPAPKIGGN